LVRRNQGVTSRRTVDRGWFHGRRAALALACIAAGIDPALGVDAVSAHGGVATFQLGAERINPGGTIEVSGDMTTDDPVVLTLVADADGAARPITTLTALDEGHFRAFVDLPGDVPGGSYTVTASNGLDFASVPLVIAGGPVADGEQGQRPGQDEAFAGALPSPGGAPGTVSLGAPQPLRTPANAGQAADKRSIVVVVVAAIGLAFVLGTVARSRTRGHERR
jgi:hypothetical protein